MMSVSEYANDVGREVKEILSLCKKLSIMVIKYTVFGNFTSEEEASRLSIIIEEECKFLNIKNV